MPPPLAPRVARVVISRRHPERSEGSGSGFTPARIPPHRSDVGLPL